MPARNLSLLILAVSSVLPFAAPKSLREPNAKHAVDPAPKTREVEEDLTVVSGEFHEASVNRRHRGLPSADWEPWPQTLFPNLEIVHSLCGEWVDALEDALDTWESRAAATGLSFSLVSEGCNSDMNDDLTYMDDKIHVVYGSCGGCDSCAGRANVEYGWDQYPGPVTDYAVLVRIDKRCIGNDNYDGMKYILCHEIGHALGLGHNYDGDSCLGSYQDSNTPGEDDVETLEDLYGINADTGSDNTNTDQNTDSCEGNTFELILETDQYGGETSWDIKDQSDTIVAEGSGYSSWSEYEETVECLDADTAYTFTIYDSYGDGICCGFGQGSYTVTYDGSIIESGGAFSDSKSFNLGQGIAIARAPEDGSCKTFILKLKTDEWGSETSWYVKDSSNNVVAEGSGYDNDTSYEEEKCLEVSQEYTFTIIDSWGDGITGDGYYKIEYGGQHIHKGGNFGHSETKLFGS